MVRRKKRRPRSKGPLLLGILCLSVVGVLVWRYFPALKTHAPYIVAVGLVVLLLRLYRLSGRLRLASTLREIDAMNGHEFEKYLVRLFRRLGYRARNVGASGADFGADLVIEREGVRIAVQAKNYLHGRVGNDAVQQAIAGATYYDCHEAMVVTNALYTKAAFEQADRCALMPVTLWNRRDLERVLSGG